MQERSQVCSLAMQIAALLADYPRHLALDAIDISRILFRPPVNLRPESPDSASLEDSVIALQSS